MKTDANGDTLFTRYFGGPQYDVLNSVAVAADSGFMVGGFTWGFAVQEIDFYLIRTNKQGDTLWTRLISHPSGGVDYGYKVAKTYDNNFAAFGTQGTFSGDFFLNKWGNTTGNLLWSKAYGGSQNEWGFDMVETSDHGFAMTGWTSSFAGTDTNIMVIKTDSIGTLQWAKTYGGNSVDIGNAIRQTTDGGYVIAGTSSSFGNTVPKIYIVRTNAAGDTLWTRTYNPYIYIDYFSFKSVTMDVTGNDDIIMCFTTYSSGSYNLGAIKTDPNGNIDWFKIYGTAGLERGPAVLATNDGGYIFTGTSDVSNPYRAAYVIKADSNGVSGCNEVSDTTSWSYTNTTITSVTPSTIPNGTVKFTGTVVGSGATLGTACISVGIENFQDKHVGIIFPNPVYNTLNVSIRDHDRNSLYNLSISDVMGKVVYRSVLTAPETKSDVRFLKPGLYIANLSSSKGSSIIKFIKY